MLAKSLTMMLSGIFVQYLKEPTVMVMVTWDFTNFNIDLHMKNVERNIIMKKSLDITKGVQSKAAEG